MRAGAVRGLVALAVVVVAVAVIAGLLMIGSPREARERSLDARRVEQLRVISNAVDLYWTRQGRLPASLEELERAQGMGESLVDPGTGRAHEYRVLGEKRYELCASFARSPAGDGRPLQGDFWAHGAGRQCFLLEPEDVRRNLGVHR